MCAVIKNPLQRDGISQKQRLLKALLPENAKIDERTIEDILAFATGYSRLITYYNTDNVADGNWSCFYENDPCILLALLATTDTDTIEAGFKELENKIKALDNDGHCDDDNGDDAGQPAGYYDEMINIIYSIALTIQKACKKLPEGHVLKEEIIAYIKSGLHLAVIDNKQQDALIKLIGYDKSSLEPLNNYKPFIEGPDNNGVCAKAWQLDQEGYDCIFPDGSFNGENLKALFYIFFALLLKIKQRAKKYFEECMEKNDAHEPHVTLFLTFLYLFQYAIDHLNTLTRSHLLYYYEEVLCLHKQKETPDKVHVIFELAKNFHTHLVEEGTLLNAAKDDTGKQMVYALMEEVVVNKARVEELKTVYINETTGIVHTAIKADTKDGVEEKFNKDEQPQWKSLGSTASQPDEVGFALASPMFFLSEGLRAGMISYKLKNDTDVKVLQLADSFRLMYSSGKDWVEIEDIYDVAEKLLLKYPLLQKLYNDNISVIKNLVDTGFEAVKTFYEKIYPAPVVAQAVTKTPSAKAVKPATGGFDTDKILGFIQKADAGMIADFFIAEAGTTVKTKKAATASGTATDAAAYRAAVIKEILQIRSDIMAVKNAFVSHVDEKRKELDFFFIANFNSPAFSPLQTDEKNPDIKSQCPILKMLIKNNANANGVIANSRYNAIKGLKLNGVDIKVAAYGMKNIVVQNDTSILDNSKEIQPFTARPYKGSCFYLGSKEVFQKKLDVVGVQMEWADRPSNFATYYAKYPSNANNQITDNSFTVEAELLNGGIYQNIYKGGNQKLFNTAFQGKSIVVLGATKSANEKEEIELDGIGGIKKNNKTKAVVNVSALSSLQQGFELRSFQRDPYIDNFADYNTQIRRGFMRLNLSQGFFHSEYPLAYTAIVANSKNNLSPSDLPNEPYTPKLKNTSLFYVSTERTLFGANKPNAAIEEFYHITPFGYQKIEIDKLNEVFLLPQFLYAHQPTEAETKDKELLFTQGNLYIGLKDAEPEQKVNILFQVLDGTGDNRFTPPDIEWSYLVNNTWVPFKPFEIEDHTRADESSRKSLLKSGIIEFSLPKSINSEGTTILNNQLLWIRACAHEDVLTTSDSDAMLSIRRIAALPDLAAVIAQAGIAQFKNNNNSLTHLAAPLPAKKIAKFIDSRAGIKKLEQPYYSFDGRLPENDNEFYRRISERLRHKNRAICIWDYERLVLKQFPQLHKVKCLNHTGIAENLLEPGLLRLREITPGFVTISVIPDLQNKNSVNKLEPRVPVGLLDDVKLYLKKNANLFVASPYNYKLDYLQVLNPLYEPVKVKTCVRFYEGLDVAYYKYVLNEDLKRFLSPWAFDANKEINFGSTYHKSAILNFIEERKYVDVVLGFNVMHYKDGKVQPSYDPDWIIPTTSRSILTSYNKIDTGSEYEHDIEYVPYNENNPCPDCVIAAAPSKTAVVK